MASISDQINEETLKTTALIVGGGPAGALLAYLLAKSGVEVVLVEQHQDFSREFRGEGLSPGGQMMFREAGLWTQFENIPQVTFKRMHLYFKGQRIVDLSLDHSAPEYQARWVSQPAMLEMLVEEASRFHNFRFLRGVRVIETFEQSDRVEGVVIRCGKRESRIRAKYTFAADGRYSLLRRKSGLDQPKSPQAFNVVWCKLSTPDFCSPELPVMRGYFGAGHAGVVIPTHAQQLQIGWIVKKGTYAGFRERGVGDWIVQFSQYADREMGDYMRDNKEKIEQSFVLDVVSDCYDRWSLPGMCLLGDAAHPMSPFGAQGINIALRDAVVMANHFVPAFRSDANCDVLDAAALAFRRERLPEIEKIQRYQAMAPRIQLSTSRWLSLVVLWVRFLSASGILAKVARIGSRFRHPFVHGVTDVRLNI